MPPEIDPIPGTQVLPQFQNTFSYRLAISEYSCLQTLQSDSHLRLRLLVSQGLQPVGDGFIAICCLVSEDFDHVANVAYKLLPGK